MKFEVCRRSDLLNQSRNRAAKHGRAGHLGSQRVTATASLPSLRAAETRQRPDFLVKPVLTPIALSYSFKSLLWFERVRLYGGLPSQRVAVFEAAALANSSFLSANAASSARSCAVV